MSRITVDHQGTQLYYEDSGVPVNNQANYTTIVLVHGGFFHSGVYKHTLRAAPNRGVRLVVVHRRDYPGSTPYSESELEAARSQNHETHKLFMQARGLEIAVFIEKLVVEMNLPEITVAEDGSKHGGVALYGWSAGNAVTFAMLASADKLLDSTKQVLEKCIKALIIYDAPRFTIGAPHLVPGAINPFFDPIIPPAQILPTFFSWVSGYYFHSFTPTTFKETRDFTLIAQERASSHSPTIDRIPPEELSQICSPDVGPRSETAIANFDSDQVYGWCFRKAFFDGEQMEGFLKDLSVKLVWCQRSHWEMPNVAWEVIDMLKERDAKEEKGRNVEVMCQEGVNHFGHWDFPEKTVEFLARIA